MKTNFAIIIIITVGILGFILGYSMAPTDVATVRHGVSQKAAPTGGGSSGGYGGDSGGYGGDSGGYGASSGGYGEAPSGGYGAAPSGGYGAAPSGGYGQ
ncbi:MAG: hypothetical protein JRF02_05715 [Deltaproteobacteria bacterium]|jgi:hypothetical protein|nr:hypothetical protein [Deltaproteobacteria bacterium]